MADKSSPKDLEEWLEDKPKEWAQVLANRCALRVMPVLGSAIKNSNLSEVIINQLTLATMRASLLSEVATFSSALEIKSFANTAARVADAAGSTVAPAHSVFVAGSALDLGAARAAGAAVIVSARAIDAPSLTYDAALKTISAYIAPHGKNAAEAVGLAAVAAGAADTALGHDVRWLQNHGGYEYSPQKLLSTPLWQGAKNPFLLEWESFKESLKKFDANWQFWISWYQSKLDGISHLNLTQAQQDQLFYQIATFPNELWEEGADVVNQLITQLMEEIKVYESITEDTKEYDFFLSYSTKDEHLASLIADIILREGHTVFAQFKDMPVGSNFITEMQEGLENSSKFICLYSENYWTSDYCQQEWNAAITFDPRGKKRKIIPFLISESAIPPLARPLVYKNLIGLNDEEFQKAVLEAIESDGVITSEQARKVAKETISPEPFINDDQELDIRANEAYDQQRVTEDLLDMPDLQSNIIEILLAHCEKSNSVPSVVKNSLNKYLAELTKNNIQARVTILDDAVDFLEIQMNDEKSEVWLDKTMEKGLSKLLSNHSKIKSHYPLDPIRQENYKEAPIDPHILDDREFLRKDDQMKFVTKDLEKEGKVSSEFVEYLKQQNERLIEILSINPSLISKSPDDAVLKSKKELDLDDLKKRHLLQKSGFVDRLSETLNKPDKIVASPSLNLLAKIAKELGDWIWK